MTFDRISRHVRLYARATGLIAEIRIKMQLRKALLGAFAVGMAIFGIAMLNLAAYHALVAVWGDIWTPLVIGLFDLVVAGLALFVGSRMHHGAELQVAEQLRDSVAADLESDLHALRTMPGLTGLLGGAIPGGTAGLLMPALSLILSALRRKPPARE